VRQRRARQQEGRRRGNRADCCSSTARRHRATKSNGDAAHHEIDLKEATDKERRTKKMAKKKMKMRTKTRGASPTSQLADGREWDFFFNVIHKPGGKR